MSLSEASAAAPSLRGCSCQDMAHSRMAAGARSFIFIQWWPTPGSLELGFIVGLLFQLISCSVAEFSCEFSGHWGPALGQDAMALQQCSSAISTCSVFITHSSAAWALRPLFLLLPLTKCQKQNPEPPSENKFLWICLNIEAVEATRYQAGLFYRILIFLKALRFV